MEKLQPQLENSRFPIQTIPVVSKIVMSLIASGVMGACSTPPKKLPNTQYTPVYEEPIYVPVYREPILTKKVYTSNGPLGDKMCEYTYNTQQKVLALCETKEPIVVRSYSKVIPSSLVAIPGKTIIIPGKTEFGYRYGIGMNGKYGYSYGPQYTQPKNEHTMPRIESIPAKLVSCKVVKPFDQKDGSQIPTRDFCN
ncbi:hypothetical protein H7169_01135 [Candidatus Gracilibacteria bacterium]|nr:hypothetical protein [Candidatus Gracilibacteria bacterium]